MPRTTTDAPAKKKPARSKRPAKPAKRAVYKPVPISAASRIAKAYAKDQVIVVAWDGTHGKEHVTTYGRNVEQCRQAALGGDKIKRALGWPPDQCVAAVKLIADGVRRACAKYLDREGYVIGANLLRRSSQISFGSESTATIAAWANATFGASSNMSTFLRAQKEWVELKRKLEANDGDPDAVTEIADVVIVLQRIAAAHGKDLYVEIDRKMAINRARKWELTGDGHGQHVEEGPSDGTIFTPEEIERRADSARRLRGIAIANEILAGQDSEVRTSTIAGVPAIRVAEVLYNARQQIALLGPDTDEINAANLTDLDRLMADIGADELLAPVIVSPFDQGTDGTPEDELTA